MLIVDSHQDIAWNALTFGRDYTSAAIAIRQREFGTDAPKHNGSAMLGMGDWLLGHVGVIAATLFSAPIRRQLGPWDTQSYRDADDARNKARAQLDYYLRLADEHPLVTLIRSRADLDAVVASWQGDSAHGGDITSRRIGLLVLMEGADAIREPAEVAYWYEHGVRMVGLAWAGTQYAGGTGEPGPLTRAGHELLDRMTDLGMMLDLSHMTDDGVDGALDRFEGVLCATHANPRHFAGNVPYPERYLRDDQLRRLAERDGVVGIVPYNRFLYPGWTASVGKARVTVAEHVTAVIDHVCQVIGNAHHVGIGSDFDGGFGMERAPAEIDTVADLTIIADALAVRGYSDTTIRAIMADNWLRLYRRGLQDK